MIGKVESAACNAVRYLNTMSETLFGGFVPPPNRCWRIRAHFPKISVMEASNIALSARISGIVLTPGNDGYEESLKRWASNSEKKAAYVVMAENPDDISETVMPTRSKKHQYILIEIDQMVYGDGPRPGS
jgi:hypothetical protein